MQNSHLVKWDGSQFRVSWTTSLRLPEFAIITTAHGYCFFDDSLLVVENHRGFELPGGHLEPQEDYKAAFIREVDEEASVKISEVSLLGYIQVELLDEAPPPDYPLVSYMAFCKAEIVRIDQYVSDFECTSRDFIEPVEIRNVHHTWHEIYEPSLKSAIDLR
jgi:ADP-ribose pyrophosphatase YjhB (NUDIX family)